MFKSLIQFFKSKSNTSNIKKENAVQRQERQDIEGWITPYSAQELLNTELRQHYLGLLWQQVSMTREMFEHLYQKPIERYAEMVQLLPASESHHHAHLGGMLDHGLEVISFAAKLRENYVLPLNAAPEEQAKQKDAWTAAVIYSALVHDIGKSIVDIEIQLQDGKRWFTWNGIPTLPYKFRYIKQRDYELHPVLGGFVANQLISKEIFDWVATYPEVFSALMYAMAGHYDKANVLAEIVQKADQNSVALALGGDITKLVQKPVISFAKQLILALRYLVSQKFKISSKGPGDGWLTEEGLWLMSKTTADQIRAYLMGQGISVPGDNRKLFDEMQAHQVIESTSEGTAIWYCQLRADAGWKPKDKFSLLRIKPEVIWDNIDDRPELFAGTICVVEKENEAEEKISNTVNEVQDTVPINRKENIELTSNLQEKNTALQSLNPSQNPEAVVENCDNNSVDFLLNMFSDNNEQQVMNIPSADAEAGTTMILKSEPENLNTHIEVEANAIPKLPTNDDTHLKSEGQKFVDWLKDKLFKKQLTFNDRTAKVHIVNDCLFIVSPSSFELYLQEKGESYDEECINNLQYEFQALGLHRKRIIKNDTINFWRCKVIGPKKESFLVGYLVPNTRLFFGDKILINNRHLLLEE
ncbi:relaxase [Actinobacillus seminis]|uniref:Predicted HD-superfamily hydrolase n=1 Tax=Actinobacillus seminis TaxID=722 RepID=A0A263HE63_9PAST|nr:MobH family relaxase [Actinobacillus seminis]OZN25720.1 relaxase [Actinobacillus seminis]SUU36913.1 Predicted HD-superfamily hydrolase [Actinobacillus seminis]